MTGNFIQNVMTELIILAGSQPLFQTGTVVLQNNIKANYKKSVEKSLTHQMDTNRNTSDKKTKRTWPGTCTSQKTLSTDIRVLAVTGR